MRIFFILLLSVCINKAFASQNEEINMQFMPIFRQIVRFHEFLQDPVNHDVFIERPNDSLENREDLRKSMLEQKNDALKSAEFYLQKGEDVLYGRETVESLLQFALKERLNGLVQRTQKAIKTVKYKAKIKLSDSTQFHRAQLPCDPQLASFTLEQMDIDKKAMDIDKKAMDIDKKAVEKHVIQRAITQYQFASLICSSLYKILPLNKLSRETINLIRSSPQLWPLLENKTSDLGNPDQAGGYAIVKAYLGTGTLSLDSLKAIAKRIHNNKYCTLWEQIKPSIDAELYSSNFCNHGEKVIPLAYPDFLKIKLTHQESIKIEPSFFDLFPFEKLDVEEEKNDSLPSFNTNADNSEMTSNIQCHLASNQITIDETAAAIAVLPAAEIIEQIHHVQQPPTANPKFRIRNNFHELMPETPYPVKQLNRKQQKFVDKIFDSCLFKKVTFGQFSNFWAEQGCTIDSSRGGSHRSLIGPNGDSLFGTFAHNDAHTYTHKTIKYLQAALWYIGCRPEDGGS